MLAHIKWSIPTWHDGTAYLDQQSYPCRWQCSGENGHTACLLAALWLVTDWPYYKAKMCKYDKYQSTWQQPKKCGILLIDGSHWSHCNSHVGVPTWWDVTWMLWIHRIQVISLFKHRGEKRCSVVVTYWSGFKTKELELFEGLASLVKHSQMNKTKETMGDMIYSIVYFRATPMLDLFSCSVATMT